MSASQDKKTRSQQRAEGTERRQVAAQKKAQEDRKSRAKWIAGTIAVVVLVAAILIGNSSLFYRQKALKVADETYSVAEVNYFYNVAYQNFYSTYGSAATYFGLNTNQPLDSQEYTMSDEFDTWADYFLNEAKQSMTEITALSKAAAEEGMTLSEEDQEEIDEQIESIKEYAKSAGYSSASKYMEAIYGRGTNEQIVRAMMEKSMLASNYAQEKQNSFTYTDDEIKEEYANHASEYDLFSLSYYLVAAETETSTDDDGHEVSAPTDETMAAAKEVADKIAEATKDAKTFAAAVAELGEPVAALDEEGNPTDETNPAEPTVVEDSQGSNLSMYSFADWANDDSRKVGDVGVIEDEDSGYYVVLFQGRDGNDYHTVDVRHILIQVTDADEDGEISDEEKAEAEKTMADIQAEWDASDKTEDTFAALAEEYSQDHGSHHNGGLYEHVYKGQMVTEFDDFCFADGRKTGDVELVYNESTGYHLIYFVGENDLYCDYLGDQLLRSEDYSAWQEEYLADFTSEDLRAMRYVG